MDARITSWTDRNDSTFRYVYDDAGWVVSTIGPDGYLSSTFAYDTHPETGDPTPRRYSHDPRAGTPSAGSRTLQSRIPDRNERCRKPKPSHAYSSMLDLCPLRLASPSRSPATRWRSSASSRTTSPAM
ncbi:hypothetical protein [Streptomyces sp. NPDC019224]|uniref:RHS repeat domain-containing protein n=1 Tax=Streptomyces sp. NPDC019224 TaxID=3154484 RepID=UPI0033CCD356